MMEKENHKPRIFKEKLKWSFVILFGTIVMLFMSPSQKEKNVVYYFLHPHVFFQPEQSNPILRLATKVFPPDIADSLKQRRNQ